MRIREAMLGDAASVQAVAQAAWHAAHDPILGDATVEQLLKQWYDQSTLEERSTREDAPMFLAVIDSEVVGFIQGIPSESEADPAEAILGSIYIHPDHWNEGIGTRLLHRLFEDFQEREWNSICLAVLTENEVGRSFYEKHGFEVHEERTVELAGQQAEDLVLLRELC